MSELHKFVFEGLPVRGLRIGWLADMGVGLPLDPQVRQASADAAAAMAAAQPPSPPPMMMKSAASSLAVSFLDGAAEGEFACALINKGAAAAAGTARPTCLRNVRRPTH